MDEQPHRSKKRGFQTKASSQREFIRVEEAEERIILDRRYEIRMPEPELPALNQQPILEEGNAIAMRANDDEENQSVKAYKKYPAKSDDGRPNNHKLD